MWHPKKQKQKTVSRRCIFLPAAAQKKKRIRRSPPTAFPYKKALGLRYRRLLSDERDLRRGVAGSGGYPAGREEVVDAVHVKVGVDLVLRAKKLLLRRDAAGYRQGFPQKNNSRRWAVEGEAGRLAGRRGGALARALRISSSGNASRGLPVLTVSHLSVRMLIKPLLAPKRTSVSNRSPTMQMRDLEVESSKKQRRLRVLQPARG